MLFVSDVIQKTNITTNGTKAGSGNETQTEDPVIINGSTFPLPGTQITGGKCFLNGGKRFPNDITSNGN